MSHKLYINKWEPKEVRSAHNDEKVDNRQLLRYLGRLGGPDGMGARTNDGNVSEQGALSFLRRIVDSVSLGKSN